jgi:uncharacterized protein (TIGR02001 family)
LPQLKDRPNWEKSVSRLAALVLIAFALPSFAQDGVGGSLSLTSDYVFRGISQTHGAAAEQGDLHYSSPNGLLAGLWGSPVELNWRDGRTVELDAYLGYRWSMSNDWSGKISAVHYAYPWNAKTIDYDYDEVIGSVAFRDNLFFTAAWSFDASRFYTTGLAKDREALSYEVAAAQPLYRSLAANVGVGHYYMPSSTGVGYTYWNVGLGYDWRSWHADISYIGTSHNAEELFLGGVAGKRVAATLLWRF